MLIDLNIKYAADMSCNEVEPDQPQLYRQAVGALLYATQCVRLDGTYAVS
jgi:hypothetical protein